MYIIGQEEIDAVATVIRSGQLFRYRGGEDGEVSKCEKFMNENLGCAYSVATTSGTGALICGLVGLGIGPGDEVIVPAYTWLASAGAILSVGAIPVLADVDETLTLDPVDFEKRIGPHTKAVIPVQRTLPATAATAPHSSSRRPNFARRLPCARRRSTPRAA
jgi:dTDP-4-amino-4,6-dideoxygalactose transaminase